MFGHWLSLSEKEEKCENQHHCCCLHCLLDTRIYEDNGCYNGNLIFPEINKITIKKLHRAKAKSEQWYINKIK